MKTFDQLPIHPSLLKSIAELGYQSPTPIQSQALPILLGDDTDFLGLAATGTGKTATFGIPLLQKIDTSKKSVQALIMCPTRELAVQVAGQIELLGKHIGVRTATIYGGASYTDQIQALKRGAMVAIGTPGRIVDHLTRGQLSLENLKVLVLDEADEMISMGFADEMEQILDLVPKDASNTWLFSATMNAQVANMTKKYLTNPAQIQINRTEVLSSTVEQLFYSVRESDKPEVLCKLIDSADDFYGIIFCQTKLLVQELSTLLSNKGYRVDSLHGDKDQKGREHTLKGFREKKVKILVCTDVAARGIDVKDITHVVNYSLPWELDNYVHRIGRTARSGKAGIAMNLVSPANRRLIFAIERYTKSRMVEGKIPTRKEIGLKKIAQMLPQFSTQPNSQRALEILDSSWKESLAGLSSEEVAARFIAMMMPDLFNDRERSSERGLPMKPHGSSRPRRSHDEANEEAPRRPRYEGRDRARSFDREPGQGGNNDRRDYREFRPGSRSERPARSDRPARPDRPAREDGRPRIRDSFRSRTARPEGRSDGRREFNTDRRSQR